MIVSDYAVRNRVTVLVLVLLIIVGGAYSYLKVPRESAPDVKFPVIQITTIYEGVSPEDVESAVTIKIENELVGLKGLKELTSTSAEGMSLITLEFLPDIDVEEALRRTKDKVDTARGELPQELEKPVVAEISVEEFPVMIVNVTGTISPVRLKVIADELEDAFKGIPGVLDVDVLGDMEREIRIEVDQDRLAAYGLTIPELMTLIPSENVNVSAGGLETPGTRFNVRITGEFAKPEEMQTLQIASRDDKPIYLTDVATVRDTFKDRTSIARVKAGNALGPDGLPVPGKPSISLSIQKRSGENMLAIADRVEAILAEARKIAPAGVDFEVTLDRSKDIRRMIRDLENNIASGLVLVVLVLMLFMGMRTSSIVALAIPLSMLISFAVIYAIGFTLNMIVLFALILALGMLVDNAIVIVENIHRYMEMGHGRFEAARKGAAEVAWPVITSTLTTIAAFAPLLFWPGIMGDFMSYLPATLIITLSASLFVALVISPTLSATLAGGQKRHEHHDGAVVRGYRRLLAFALSHRATTLCLAVLLLAGLVTVYSKRAGGVELFPNMDPNRAIINLRAPQGTNIKAMDELAREVESRIEQLPPEQRREIAYVLTNIGSSGGFVFGGGAGGPHQANITLVFSDYEVRRLPSENVIDTLRQRLSDLPGVEVKVEGEQAGPPTGDDVEVRIVGRDFETLQNISADAKRIMSGTSGLVNLRSDFESAKPELVFDPDRARAVKMGVNTQIIGQFIKTAIFGSKVGVYRQFNDEYDITVRLPENQRDKVEDLFRLRVPNNTGQSVPLSSLGRFEYRPGLGTINRINQKRVITLSGSAAKGVLPNDVLTDVMERLDKLGRNRIIRSDVRDWQAFASDIVNGQSNTGRRIGKLLGQGLFNKKALEAMNKLAKGQPLVERDSMTDEQYALATDRAWTEALTDFNARVLASDKLYDESLAPPSELGQEARDLLAQAAKAKLDSKQQMRLNRLVLQQAYPQLLVAAEKLELPPGYEIAYAGEREEQDEAMSFLLGAFVFALLLIVMILVAQFNTLSVPVIIMATVVLSLAGAFLGLLVHDKPFGIIMTGVGVISLAGVVVNNAIVLLDYTRNLQRQGMELVQAAVEAGRTRLRPVLLTAGTTLLGLIPMASGQSFDFHSFSWSTRSESSQWWSSMAIVVIYGLGLATVLTLVIVPTLYVSIYRLLAKGGMGGLKTAEQVELEARQAQLTPPPLPSSTVQ